jgi:hypothetical protein
MPDCFTYRNAKLPVLDKIIRFTVDHVWDLRRQQEDALVVDAFHYLTAGEAPMTQKSANALRHVYVWVPHAVPDAKRRD